jgi:hypothetical protein
MAVLLFVGMLTVFWASSPFWTDRTARIIRAASSRTKCRTASKPRPVLEPVTRMVWPAKDVVGIGIDCNCARIAESEDMLGAGDQNR